MIDLRIMTKRWSSCTLRRLAGQQIMVPIRSMLTFLGWSTVRIGRSTLNFLKMIFLAINYDYLVKEKSTYCSFYV